MAHAHKVTKADRRNKGRRKDQGAATMAALKRLDARNALEKAVFAEDKPPLGPRSSG